MTHNTGECPVCKQNIAPGDDAVVCPDCGTPYHRACWQKNGQCVHADKHAQGFEYTPPQPEAKVPPGATGGEYEGPAAVCQSCGASNPSRNIFCDSCGNPLHGKAPMGQDGDQPQNPFGGFGGFGAGQNGAGGPVFMNMGFDLAGDIDDIPKRDWNVYIGSSQATYLTRMSQQQMRNTKTSFMFSAFFVPHYFFAYRKMWGAAAVATLLRLVCYMPSVLLLLQQSGYNVGLAESQISLLGSVANWLWLAIGLVSSLFSLWLYRQSGAKKIKTLREKYSNDGEYQAALQKAGGVSVLGVVLVAIVVFAFFMVTSQMVSQDVIYSYMNYYLGY